MKSTTLCTMSKKVEAWSKNLWNNLDGQHWSYLNLSEKRDVQLSLSMY